MCTCKKFRYPANYIFSTKLASLSCSYKQVSATTPQTYLPHDCESLNNNKQDTQIKVILLSIKVMHPTICNKQARASHSHRWFSQQPLYMSLNHISLTLGPRHCLSLDVFIMRSTSNRSMITHLATSMSKTSFESHYKQI